MDDILRVKVRQTPFKPQHFPFIFLFMDTPLMFEVAFKLLWGEEIAEVTG